MIMRTIPGALLIAVLTPTAIAAVNLRVETHQISQDRYDLIVRLPSGIDAVRVQSMLRPAADQVCEGRAWQWGPHRFESTARLGPGEPQAGEQTFTQQVDCGATATQDLTAVAAPDAPATADDERRVKETTLAYLLAKDTGDFAKARSMQTEEAKLSMPPDWSESRAAFNQQAGQPAQRQVVRLTWYDNPQGAPRKGRYVAADYRGDYRHAGFYCGYAMWYREADGSYRLVREEEGQVSDETASKIAAADLPAFRKPLGCRD
ncbi:DUF4019 domain-containing protein [Lysobacter capsici]|uniref:DUF4019 domain-containing protein n=1 Tax=Lysobacter capsici TaxID=435897 RepID=UPI0017827751|nr:DUF4019 domain-containing protein [Lysobacter capsici]UOF12954.1 DUF4019 domain-containing protein [Lysobacter capsici]